MIDSSTWVNCASLTSEPSSFARCISSISSITVTMACGVTCASIFASSASDIRLRIGLIRQLAERRELNPLELGLGDDLAVHLDEHLLENLG